ncbi:hypothetical protein [Salinivibrio sp. ES.052]|uniref:hypothetical protein n=1 Tax=Salinivibrio sp. ES.052 TaxID=1882823 RepID=UPI0009414A1F|nr:hypothetical protein [Salinivibrio sp. ES.052]
MLRRTTRHEVTLWSVMTHKPANATVSVYQDHRVLASMPLSAGHWYRIGEHAWIVLHHLRAVQGYPMDTPLTYDIQIDHRGLAETMPDILYANEHAPHFTIPSNAHYIAHGSCRHPHHRCDDALVTLDQQLADTTVDQWPNMLIMSGDQIYADDVATPMLQRIRALIHILGLKNEHFEAAPITNCRALDTHPDSYMGRDQLLPKQSAEKGRWWERLSGQPLPIFTSKTVSNHLISFAEHIAMYLMVWSPTPWTLTDTATSRPPAGLTQDQHTVYQQQTHTLAEFRAGLVQVQRLFAHLPTYMIFDDHDITDDWNITVGWEQAAYFNPFARRIIGNGLMAYWLCQGWGNAPDNFDKAFLTVAKQSAYKPIHVDDGQIDAQTTAHQAMVELCLRFEHWHYTVPTTPHVVVLDTRTRRWRSESRMNKPSGLMDWEALMDFQHDLLRHDSAIIVSAAPMFGVKFIEVLQRIAIWLGIPTVVDAENWMAHPGSANTLLSIFRHQRTPTNYVILSGDVHYSFAYDIRTRFRANSPHLWQITASGFKNRFPEPLLAVCEWCDRLLFHPYSPLNWLTKRKRMHIARRDPDTPGPKRLVNASAVGLVRLHDDGSPNAVTLLKANGDRVCFPDKSSSHSTVSHPSSFDSL